MPYCYVPGCRGGSIPQQRHYKENNLPKLHFFRPPNEEAMKEWNKLIRKIKPLRKTDTVCSAHFLKEDIVLEDQFLINGKIETFPRDRATLRPGAMPLLLEHYPKYYQPKIKRRREPSKRSPVIPKKRKIREFRPNVTDPQVIDNRHNLTGGGAEEKSAPTGLQEPEICDDNNSEEIEEVWSYLQLSMVNISGKDPSKCVESIVDRINKEHEPTLQDDSPEIVHITEGKAVDSAPADVQETARINVNISEETGEEWSCLKVNKLNVPFDWVICNTRSQEEKFIAHIYPVTQQIDKTITFRGTEQPVIRMRGIAFNMQHPPVTSIRDVQNLVIRVNRLRLCTGTGNETNKFSASCEGGVVHVNAKRCKACRRERARLRKSEARKMIRKNRPMKKVKLVNRVRSSRRSELSLPRKVHQYKIRIEKSLAALLEEEMENIKRNSTFLEEDAAELELEEDAAGLELEEDSAELELEEDAAGLELEEDAAGLELEEDAAELELEEDAAELELEEDAAELELLAGNEDQENLEMAMSECVVIDN